MSNLETYVSKHMCYNKSAFLYHEDILVLTERPSQLCYTSLCEITSVENRPSCSLGYMLMAKQNNLGFKLFFGEATAKIIKI